MKNLEKYFDLFDQSRTSEKAMEELVSLFSDDIVFILNGHEKREWKTGSCSLRWYSKKIVILNICLKDGEKWKEPIFLKHRGRCVANGHRERYSRKLAKI